MRQMPLALIDAPPPSFDNFIAGRNAALLACLAGFGSPALADRCLYLWGEAGSGRSHLLNAWRARHAGSPLHAVVDDVETQDDAGQVALFNRYEAARAGEGWLLVAGSAAPRDLALRDDLKSRFAWGLAFEVLPLSDEEKSAALARHAAALGMTLGEDLRAYLLSRARRDMPGLIALIDTLNAYSLEAKRPVTLPLLRDLLNQNRMLPL
ncbi:MAG: DnaA regulatory inactivator Hda [Burkholderiales bacterium]|nr:DnaA regulatory inactivator Hda [Burkholderiales bacterium]